MSDSQYEIRAGTYFDSVVLMQLQRSLAALPGVLDAGVVMATAANLELLAVSALLPTGIAPKPDDMLIVVKGEDKASASKALAQVDQLLKRRRSKTSHDFRPRSLAAAATVASDASLVLISVPGRYAASVARDAIKLNKHVFLYSDNVSMKDEAELKRLARERGLLMMGPDCGTAIIASVGLGFANRVRPGNIGLIGASGTGLQAISSEIHNLGGGVSQAIGTGGRDLKKEIGAITARQALLMLASDPATKVILLISKPPESAVVSNLLRVALATRKPVVVNLIGYPVPGRQLGNLHFSTHLCDAAELAVQLSNQPATELHEPRRPFSGYVRGLFSGGTIAYEMLQGLQAVLSPVYSNIPIRESQRLADVWTSEAHTVLDLGEDVFTQGRLHPMMDNELRLRRMRQELVDPAVGLILLDVVLGEGSHPDPAAELAPAVAEARRNDKRVAAIVVGTDEDPQDLNRQIEGLMAAGATVFATANEALDYVYNRVKPPLESPHPIVDLGAFGGTLSAINVGLEAFHDSLVEQGAKAVQVDWRPPAGGNEKLMAILAKMKS
jgi:FdrA protein